MKKLFLWVKTIITIPLQIIKYDLIDNNKKDINFIFKLYKDFEEIIKKLKEIYNSEKFFEELKKSFHYEDKGIEFLELIYKIIDAKELNFALGFTNNKLGFKINPFTRR